MDQLQPISYYAREVRAALPEKAFKPVRNRLLWLLFHLVTVGAGWAVLINGWGGILGSLAAVILVGHAFGGMAFVGHETLHGAVVRSRVALGAIGWLSFLPFALSPRLWVAWHNRTHHQNTARPGIDPDAFPMLEEYKKSTTLKLAELYSFGRRKPFGLAMVFTGFTFQGLQVLFYAGPRGYLDAGGVWRARLETLLGWALWATFGVLVGFKVFLLGFIVPLLIGNAVVMAYILTNHSLSPKTEVNDPLVNSLSVTTLALFNAMHLNFGLHVEHHVFPAMSSAYAPLVRAQLQARWPTRYQSMGWGKALWQLWRTPRVQLDSVTMVNPKTSERYPCLGVLQPATSKA